MCVRDVFAVLPADMTRISAMGYNGCLPGVFDGVIVLFCLTDLFSAMFAWVLLANLQANLTQFRCIPHYVTHVTLEQVAIASSPDPSQGCGYYARLHCKPNIVITSFSACRNHAITYIVMQSNRNGDKRTLFI